MMNTTLIPLTAKHRYEFRISKKSRVITPDGEGLVEEIVGDKILVKLDSGETKIYPAKQLEDDSDQG